MEKKNFEGLNWLFKILGFEINKSMCRNWEKIYRNLRESNYGNYIIMEIMSSWDYLIRRYKWVFIEVGFVEK